MAELIINPKKYPVHVILVVYNPLGWATRYAHFNRCLAHMLLLLNVRW